MSQTLSNVSLGSIVIGKTASGSDINFKVVHHGNPNSSVYTDCPSDAVWLVTDAAQTTSVWGSTTQSYAESTIKAAHETFRNTFADDLKNALLTISIPYLGTVINSPTTGTMGSFDCFPLSVAELTPADLSSRFGPSNGAVLDYFNSTTNSIRRTSDSSPYWTRSVYLSDYSQKSYITLAGSIQYIDGGTEIKIRPCIVLPGSSITVDDNNYLTFVAPKKLPKVKIEVDGQTFTEADCFDKTITYPISLPILENVLTDIPTFTVSVTEDTEDYPSNKLYGMFEFVPAGMDENNVPDDYVERGIWTTSFEENPKKSLNKNSSSGSYWKFWQYCLNQEKPSSFILEENSSFPYDYPFVTFAFFYSEKDINSEDFSYSDMEFLYSFGCTFGKKVTHTTVKPLKSLALSTTTGDISIAILGGAGDIPEDCIVSAKVTNNANDTSPIWQDCTNEFLAESNIVFKNTSHDNAAAFNFEVNFERGASDTGGYITMIGGAFQ